ncbi:MAG: hypothetical protein LBF23_00390 [Endomicrobium sp.]|nr:hypothetical protein [Endomicrobium sp.]
MGSFEQVKYFNPKRKGGLKYGASTQERLNDKSQLEFDFEELKEKR